MTEAKVVAICQYGGEFFSSSDGSLNYRDGEAHAIEVSHETLLNNLKSELAALFKIEDTSGISLKYFLPNNRRTLITISCDKDLQRMVDFTANAAAADVFIINKNENRSTIAHSGTSTAATATDARNAKRKKSAAGNRPNKNSSQQVDSRLVNSCANSVGNGNISKQKRPSVPEHVDHRPFPLDYGNDFAFAALRPSASVSPDIIRQQKMTLADGLVGEPTGMLVDSVNPYIASLSSMENARPMNSVSLWDDIFKIGQEFDNVKDFRAQLCKYAISKGFVYRFVKNETTRVTVKCVGENCPWRLHASETSRNKKFVIKRMNNVHNCGGGSGEGQRRASRQWLTSVIKDKLRENHSCKPKDLVRELYEDYGVRLTYSQVWRGREVAQKELYQAQREIYQQLPSYCHRIQEANHGSFAVLLTPPLPSNFRRFFIAYHACLSGFEQGCRPLLFLDKVPLKATNEYKLLTAASVDADDAIFPVAFAVVESENVDSWHWFLQHLRYALAMPQTITFVSTGQKGLEAAVTEVFEDCPHAFCLHYLIEEFKAELKKGPWSQQIRDGMVEEFTRAAQACSIDDFNASIENVRNISSEAAEWIIASKPVHWSDAFFRGCRYDHFSSNIVDSFDNWIPPKQESSIVQLAEALRIKLTEVILSRRESCKDWTGVLAPRMELKLQKEASKARKLHVLCSSETIFEVRGSTIYVVNIGCWECTCRRWQLSGLPCMHAIAVFERIGRSVYDYCAKYFRVESYHCTYAGEIYPIPNMENDDYMAGYNIYPFPTRRPPDGRPRRRRFNPNKTTTVVRLCSRCKMSGHNKATCEALM